jgi:FtsZ-interacting cell division protein ZipA
VAEWWQACEKSGLTYGDGNLFWLLNESASEDNFDEPYEYFSVEPYSQRGYFHRGDLNSSMAFPDVALSFRVRDFKNPHNVLDKMIAVADLLADKLGANVLEPNGNAFDARATRQRLDHALERLRSLENAKQ